MASKEIERLNNTEKKTIENLQKQFVGIVKRNLKKSRLKGKNKGLYDDLGKLSKTIVKSGINMGTRWLSKHLN